MTIKEARTKTNRPAEEIAKLLGFPLKTWLAWEEGELLIVYPVIRALRKKHIPVYINYQKGVVAI